jgi:hypothetical protein
MQNNPHVLEELDEEVNVEQDDEFEPKVARAIAYLNARIKIKQRALEEKYRQSPQSQSFEDVFDNFLQMFEVLILKYNIKTAQRNIQKLQSPMFEDTESLMESVLHEQHTEQQVKMMNMMIDDILDHWLLAPLRFLLPQVVKDDMSKLIVGIGSMFGSDQTQSFHAHTEDENERNQFAPHRFI